jgi:hypothetical protein
MPLMRDMYGLTVAGKLLFHLKKYLMITSKEETVSMRPLHKEKEGASY